MKRIALFTAVALFSLYSCGSGQANSNKKEATHPETGQNEKEALAATTANQHVKGGSINLTKAVFLDKVWNYNDSPQAWKYKGDKPALIDFYADWCGPCKIASPILDEIANEYTGKIYVYKIDTEVEKELAAVFGIRGIPAFLYIPVQGEPVMLSGIQRTKEDTKKMFTDNINKYLLTSN